MKPYLLSLIPWCFAVWGFMLIVFAYTGEWPNRWAIVGALFLGVAWGSRRFA